jgi:hypothetical protein
MNAQIRIQQPMQKASEMTVENLDHKGLVADLIDDLEIVPGGTHLIEHCSPVVSIF